MDMPKTYTERMKRFTALNIIKRHLKDRLEAVEREMNGLNEVLLEDFAELGQKNAKIGNYTVYMHSQLWAGAVKVKDANGDDEGDYATSCQALDEAGLGHMVSPRFNTNTLSAYVRELPLDEETFEPILPPELVGRISVVRKTELRTRKSGRGS